MPFSSDPALQMETTERIRPVKIFFGGGRPSLRRALEDLSTVELTVEPLEADCLLVDLASLTPAQHAECLRYPLIPDLPLIVISAQGVDGAIDDNPYLEEVARGEALALSTRPDCCVLRCSPMDADLDQVIHQVLSYSAAYGCFGPSPVAWLTVADLADLIRKLTDVPTLRDGRIYEVAGQEGVSLPDLVNQLTERLKVRAEYYELTPGQVVSALCSSVGWDLDTALRVPHHQQWVGSPKQTSGIVERALGRPPRPLDLTRLIAASTANSPGIPVDAHSSR